METILTRMEHLRNALAAMLEEQQLVTPVKLVTLRNLGHALANVDLAIVAERAYEEAT